MAMNGSADEPPLKFGVAAVDLFTGQFSAQAVLAALYERERTGRGREIEMSLLAGGLALTSYVGLAALQLGRDPDRVGNQHPSIVPYGVYEAADGTFVITVGNNAQFRRFCAVIGEEALLDDARFLRPICCARQNREAIEPTIVAALKRQTRADLLPALAAAGIPCGEVLGLHEALTSPRARAAGLVAETDGRRRRCGARAGAGLRDRRRAAARSHSRRRGSAPIPTRSSPSWACLRPRGSPRCGRKASWGDRGRGARPCALHRRQPAAHAGPRRAGGAAASRPARRAVCTASGSSTRPTGPTNGPAARRSRGTFSTGQRRWQAVASRHRLRRRPRRHRSRRWPARAKCRRSISTRPPSPRHGLRPPQMGWR